MKTKNPFIVLAALLMAGCVQYKPNFTPKEFPRVVTTADADLQAIAVTVASPSATTRHLDYSVRRNPHLIKLYTEAWQAGLEDAVKRALAFSPRSARKVNLRVTIVEFDVPAIGFAMTTRTAARYEIQDRASGAILFNEEIAAEGQVPALYAFEGEKRAKESLHRAVQNNILSFLRVLGEKGLKEAKPAVGSAEGNPA